MFALIITAILLTFSTVISEPDKYFLNGRIKIRNLTGRSVIVLYLNAAVVIISLIQYRFAVQKQENDKIASDRAAFVLDSTNKARYDSSLLLMKEKYDLNNQATMIAITETLIKYGYLLDSSNKGLIKIIKDSSKTKIVESMDPILELITEPKGINIVKNEPINRFDGQLYIGSADAGSTNFNVKCYMVLSESFQSKDYKFGGVPVRIGTGQSVSSNGVMIKHFYTIYDLEKYKFIYIIMKGTYSNMSLTKSFNIESVYYYNYAGGTFGSIDGDTRKRVIDFIQPFLNR